MPSKIRKRLSETERLNLNRKRREDHQKLKELAKSGDLSAQAKLDAKNQRARKTNLSLSPEQKLRKKETTRAWFERRKEAAQAGDEAAIASIEEYRERYLPRKREDSKKRWAKISVLAKEGDEKALELVKKSRLNSIRTINRLLMEDVGFRLRHNVRSRVNNLIKSGKPSSTTKALGCTKHELIEYIEARFDPWMTWQNYGKYDPKGPRTWCLDHIVPLASFDLTDDEQFKKANHFSNLQPLCSKINSDKRDKLNYEIPTMAA